MLFLVHLYLRYSIMMSYHTLHCHVIILCSGHWCATQISSCRDKARIPLISGDVACWKLIVSPFHEFPSTGGSCFVQVYFPSQGGSLYPMTFNREFKGTSPSPQFGTSLKGHLSFRAPHGISWDVCCITVQLPALPNPGFLIHTGIVLKNTPQDTSCPQSSILDPRGLNYNTPMTLEADRGLAVNYLNPPSPPLLLHHPGTQHSAEQSKLSTEFWWMGKGWWLGQRLDEDYPSFSLDVQRKHWISSY